MQKLGELTSERGDAMTARKYAPRVPPLHPLTPQEEEWIRAALRAIIRRIGMIGTGVAFGPLTMGDLPQL